MKLILIVIAHPQQNVVRDSGGATWSVETGWLIDGHIPCHSKENGQPLPHQFVDGYCIWCEKKEPKGS